MTRSRRAEGRERPSTKFRKNSELCADHGERAEVNGRDENRSLGLTGPKIMNEQISEQSAYRCNTKATAGATGHGKHAVQTAVVEAKSLLVPVQAGRC
jgi:hypothetical protein